MSQTRTICPIVATKRPPDAKVKCFTADGKSSNKDPLLSNPFCCCCGSILISISNNFKPSEVNDKHCNVPLDVPTNKTWLQNIMQVHITLSSC